MSIYILQQLGIPVKGVSRTSRGWKLSAPHRRDRNPSFSIFKVNDALPDTDIHAWAVHDFAEGFTMGLRNYLREYFGVDPLNGQRQERKRQEPRPQNTLWEEIESWISGVELPEVDASRIIEANIPYRGHGFAELDIDSREYGIYLDPEDKKPVILYRQGERVVGIKKRLGDPRMKYVWEEGKGSLYWARKQGSKRLIVAEGEFKAALFAALYPDLDVVGVPSRSMLHRVPAFGYDAVLFVLDPDVANDLLSLHKDVKLEKLMLGLMYAGTRVKVLNFERHFGVKDINDYVMQEGSGVSTSTIKRIVREKSHMMRFSPKLVLKHMGIFQSKADREVQLGVALVYKVLTAGEWVNAHAARIKLDIIEMMQLTGMSHPTLYRALKALEDKGLILYKRGHLGNEWGKKGEVVVRWSRLLPFLLSSGSPSITSNMFSPKDDNNPKKGKKGEGKMPMLMDLSGYFSNRGKYLLPYEELGVRFLVVALDPTLKEDMGVSTPRPLNRVRALVKHAKATLERVSERVRRYIRRRNYLLRLLHMVLPGTTIVRSIVSNPVWPFKLSVREFEALVLDGTLVHSPGYVLS